MEINTVTGCIALIDQHKKIHVLSALITISASILLLYLAVTGLLTLFWFVVLSAISVTGVLELVYAVRIGFDTALLRNLVKHAGDIDSGLVVLDKALVKLHLVSPDRTGRTLDARLSGCIRLFGIQAGLCVLQVIVILSSAGYAVT